MIFIYHEGNLKYFIVTSHKWLIKINKWGSKEFPIHNILWKIVLKFHFISQKLAWLIVHACNPGKGRLYKEPRGPCAH